MNKESIKFFCKDCNKKDEGKPMGKYWTEVNKECQYCSGELEMVVNV